MTVSFLRRSEKAGAGIAGTKKIVCLETPNHFQNVYRT
jgi:hypothetical protein